MPEPRQTFKIQVPPEWDAFTRASFGRDVVSTIRQRTERGIDKNGKRFAYYSDSYANSLDFRNAGKSKSNPNLRLTGEMMGTLAVVSHRRGEINIGFDAGTSENDKAAWAKASDNGPSRDFLGLPKNEIDKLTRRYNQSSLAEQLVDQNLFQQSPQNTRGVQTSSPQVIEQNFVGVEGRRELGLGPFREATQVSLFEDFT